LPFELSPAQVQASLDECVATVFASLESEFLVMPKGEGFIDYAAFESGYEALKRATGEFAALDPAVVLPVVLKTPISLIVLRTMLGFTPPEWAYMTSRRTGLEVPQGAVRTLDRTIRIDP